MIDFKRFVKTNYSEERQFQLIINDNKYDSLNGSIVDYAMGLSCEYLNMKGFFKPEKIAKVLRYQEIIEENNNS